MLSLNYIFSELLNSLSFELLFIAFILFNIVFAITLASNSELSYPSLLNILNYFSLFFFCSSLIFILPYNFVELIDNSIFGVVKSDFLNTFIKSFLVFFSILLYLLNIDFCRNRLFSFEYELLLSLSILGLLILLVCNDFLTLYIALELMSLSFYVLAGFYKNSNYSTEAGLKYFVLGALSSCLLLFGINFIYLTYGTINFDDIRLLVCENDLLCSLGLIFIFSGFFFKVGVSPFHMWLIDVYEGSLLSVTAFFSAIPKLVLFILLMKFSYIIFNPLYGVYCSVLFFLGITSIIFASVAALYQKRIKRLLAYSTVSHTGFILLGIASNTIFSLQGSIFYLLLYSFMTFASFGILLIAADSTKQFPKYLISWSSQLNYNFVLALSLSLILFSIAGIPPLAGFFSKLMILESLVDIDSVFIALIVVIFSSVACFYYIRLIKIIFFTKNFLKSSIWMTSSSRYIEFVVALSLSVILLFVILPSFPYTFSTLISLTLL